MRPELKQVYVHIGKTGRSTSELHTMPMIPYAMEIFWPGNIQAVVGRVDFTRLSWFLFLIHLSIIGCLLHYVPWPAMFECLD